MIGCGQSDKDTRFSGSEQRVTRGMKRLGGIKTLRREVEYRSQCSNNLKLSTETFILQYDFRLPGFVLLGSPQ
jgi:hypothetical protein